MVSFYDVCKVNGRMSDRLPHHHLLRRLFLVGVHLLCHHHLLLLLLQHVLLVLGDHCLWVYRILLLLLILHLHVGRNVVPEHLELLHLLHGVLTCHGQDLLVLLHLFLDLGFCGEIVRSGVVALVHFILAIWTSIRYFSRLVLLLLHLVLLLLLFLKLFLHLLSLLVRRNMRYMLIPHRL